MIHLAAARGVRSAAPVHAAEARGKASRDAKYVVLPAGCQTASDRQNALDRMKAAEGPEENVERKETIACQ
jgi:hypothetical protein